MPVGVYSVLAFIHIFGAAVAGSDGMTLVHPGPEVPVLTLGWAHAPEGEVCAIAYAGLRRAMARFVRLLARTAELDLKSGHAHGLFQAWPWRE